MPAMRARCDAVLTPVTRLTFAYATPKVRLRYERESLRRASAFRIVLVVSVSVPYRACCKETKGTLKEDNNRIKVR